jgi:hypothetical protein
MMIYIDLIREDHKEKWHITKGIKIASDYSFCSGDEVS